MTRHVAVYRCRVLASLYAAIYHACRQLTPRDGDAGQCAAIAAAEREDEDRRRAVEAVRRHYESCATCHTKNMTNVTCV